MGASVADFRSLAKVVRYVGSPEHKRLPNPLANPALRTDKSDCDAVDPKLSSADPMYLLAVLQETLRRGQVSGAVEGRFPRYVHGWLFVGEARERMLFRGRLTNREAGVYKGYFETIDDVPITERRKLGAGGPWWQVIDV
ncbi:MAG TPA: hypothetical protein VGM88_21555 [Kofleriaceae bacterium]|jgi:hypothetical protein